MALRRCPGSLSFTQPKIEMVPCPDCKADVEIWSDEATGECKACGRAVIRTASQSCVDWCRYAKECMGDEKFNKYGAMKAAMRKAALLDAVQAHHGGNDAAMAQPRKLLAYAEVLLAANPQADPNVVMSAAALYHLVHGSAATSAPPSAAGIDAARKVLEDLSSPQGLVREIMELLQADASPKPATLHGRLLHDAVLLANTEKKRRPSDRGPLSPEVLAAFETEAGRAAAAQRQVA
jgi:hypothetical protein